MATARDPDEGRWHTKGLPQHGFPYAIATTWVRAANLKLRILRADPRALRPDGAPGTGSGGKLTILSLVAPAAPTRASRTLWWHAGLFAIDAASPAKEATAMLGGCSTTAPCAASAGASVGVADEDGMLVWVELPPGTHPTEATGAAMDALLTRLGCSARMAVPGQAAAWLGGENGAIALDAGGAPLDPRGATGTPTVRFVRTTPPDAHPIFVDTPIVPISVWQPLQAKRIRYFYKPPAPPAP